MKLLLHIILFLMGIALVTKKIVFSFSLILGWLILGYFIMILLAIVIGFYIVYILHEYKLLKDGKPTYLKYKER